MTAHTTTHPAPARRLAALCMALALLLALALGLPLRVRAANTFNVNNDTDWDNLLSANGVGPLAADDAIDLRADIGAGVTETTLPVQPLTLRGQGSAGTVAARLAMPAGGGTLGLMDVHLAGGLTADGALSVDLSGDSTITGLDIGANTLTVSSGGSNTLTLAGDNTIGAISLQSTAVLRIGSPEALGGADVAMGGSNNWLRLTGGGTLAAGQVSGSGSISVDGGSWTLESPTQGVRANGGIDPAATAVVTGAADVRMDVWFNATLDLSGVSGTVANLNRWTGTLVLGQNPGLAFTAAALAGGLSTVPGDTTRLRVVAAADGEYDLGAWPSAALDDVLAFFAANPAQATATGGGSLALSRGGAGGNHLLATVTGTPGTAQGENQDDAFWQPIAAQIAAGTTLRITVPTQRLFVPHYVLQALHNTGGALVVNWDVYTLSLNGKTLNQILDVDYSQTFEALLALGLGRGGSPQTGDASNAGVWAALAALALALPAGAYAVHRRRRQPTA